MFPDDEPGIADRLLDCWEPLLAIADAAGGDWPEDARNAVTALTETLEVESLTIRLLREIRELWPAGKEWVASEELLLSLHAIEDGPWSPGGPFGERGLTPHRLARMLHPYRVSSSHNDAANTARGYLRFAFLDPWDRYVPIPSGEASGPSQASPEATLLRELRNGGKLVTISAPPANGVRYRVGPLLDTRVLRPHRDAAHEAISELLGLEIAPRNAEAIAARILAARDSDRPRYVVVLLLENSHRLITLGPFANSARRDESDRARTPARGEGGNLRTRPWPRLETGRESPSRRPPVSVTRGRSRR